MIKNKRIIYISSGLLFLFVLGIGIKFIKSRNTWVCKNGQWEKVGNPSEPMPDKPCGLKSDQRSGLIGTESQEITNPASKNCLDKGGSLSFIKETAGTLGICKFDDGSECEEWQFYREECKKGQFKNADTSHPYKGVISQKGTDFYLKDETGTEYLLKLPSSQNKEYRARLVSNLSNREAITIIAAEQPPLSKILFLKSFQEK